MKIIELVGIVTGALFIAVACIFSVVYGFTIGNAIALCLGTLLIAVGIWLRKLPQKLRKVIGCGAAAGTVCFLAITAMIITDGCRDTATYHEDAILVLGCGIRGQTILPTLQSRLDRCLDYLAMNPGIPIIVSGGQGRNEDISEAEAMKRYLLHEAMKRYPVKNVVYESQIIKEDRSHDTKDNFRYSKQILDSLFSGKDYATVCITSDYHIYRTKKTAKHEGLNINVYHAGVKWYLRPSAYCREALSICKSWIF